MQIIHKIHIDSKDFDPLTLIQTIHNDTSQDQFSESIKHLENKQNELEKFQLNIIYLFFDDFFLIEGGLSRVN